MESKRIYVDERCQFDERVGLMDRDDDFLGLPVEPRFASGLFGSQDLPVLEQFVLQNPGYHILSLPGRGVTVNSVIRTAPLYRLADGDANPSLIYVGTDKYLVEWAAELGYRSSAKSR